MCVIHITPVFVCVDLLFFEPEGFFEAFDLFFILAVADHQVVVFFGDDQVVDALYDDVFPGWDVDNAVVGIVEYHLIRVGDIVGFVFRPQSVESMPGTDI